MINPAKFIKRRNRVKSINKESEWREKPSSGTVGQNKLFKRNYNNFKGVNKSNPKSLRRYRLQLCARVFYHPKPPFKWEVMSKRERDATVNNNFAPLRRYDDTNVFKHFFLTLLVLLQLLLCSFG